MKAIRKIRVGDVMKRRREAAVRMDDRSTDTLNKIQMVGKSVIVVGIHACVSCCVYKYYGLTCPGRIQLQDENGCKHRALCYGSGVYFALDFLLEPANISVFELFGRWWLNDKCKKSLSGVYDLKRLLDGDK